MEGNERIKRFECSVFDGNYVTGDVDKDYLDRVEERRNDAAKEILDLSRPVAKGQPVGIHNNDNVA